MSEESGLEGWNRFIGSWETEGAHPLRDAPAPDLSQRFTGAFTDDGNTITGRGEPSQDGSTWEDDLALDYRRVASASRRKAES